MTDQEKIIQGELYHLIIHYGALRDKGNLTDWEQKELTKIIDVLEHVYHFPSTALFPKGIITVKEWLGHLISYNEKQRDSHLIEGRDKYNNYLSIDKRVLEQVNRILSGLPYRYSKNSRCLVVYK